MLLLETGTRYRVPGPVLVPVQVQVYRNSEYQKSETLGAAHHITWSHVSEVTKETQKNRTVLKTVQKYYYKCMSKKHSQQWYSYKCSTVESTVAVPVQVLALITTDETF
jgi:hypothetical protein